MKSPFVGSAPFEEKDADLFFGRDDDARVVLANLHASSLTILYGESAVGKSSLLDAKLIPQLRGATTFPLVKLRTWSADPTTALRGAIARYLAVEAHKNDTLAQCVFNGLAGSDSRLLVVLDQFEEYFQYRTSSDTFQEQFAELVVRDDIRVNVLISIREDALSMLDLFQSSIPQLFDNYLRLEHLDRSSARQAIEQPILAYAKAANSAQVTLEEGLVDMIITSISGDGPRVPGIHLQLVMSALWNEDCSRGVLRKATLERLGGARRIFESHFGSTIQHRLNDADRAVAERIFVLLVTQTGRKQVQTLSELAGPNDREDTQQVLDKLEGARILARVPPPLGGSLGEPAYEFVHDVLARAALEWRTERALETERRKALSERRTAHKFRVLTCLLFIALFIVGAASVVTLRALQQRQRERDARRDSDLKALQAKQDALTAEKEALASKQALVASQLRLQQEAQRASESADKATAATALARAEAVGRQLAELDARAKRDEAQQATAREAAEATLARAGTLVVYGRQLLSQAQQEPTLRGADGRRQAALALGIHAIRSVLDVGRPAPPEAEALLREAAAASSELRSFVGNNDSELGDVHWDPAGTRLYVPVKAGIVALDGSAQENGIMAAAWNSDGTQLAVAKGDPVRTVLTETTTGRILGERVLEGIYERRSVKWASGLATFAALTLPKSGPHGVSFWASSGNAPPVVVYPFRYQLSDYEWSPDGNFLLVRGVEDQNQVYSERFVLKVLSPSGAIVSIFPPRLSLYRQSWSLDNKVILAFDNQATIYDPRSGAEIQVVDFGSRRISGPIVMNPRKPKYCAFPVQQDDGIVIWDLERKRTTAFMPTNRVIRHIAWSPDGTKLAAFGASFVDIYRTAFATVSTQAELVESAKEHLARDFKFTEQQCRVYFSLERCPELP